MINEAVLTSTVTYVIKQITKNNIDGCWLIYCFMSQSTIFQSNWNGAKDDEKCVMLKDTTYDWYISSTCAIHN